MFFNSKDFSKVTCNSQVETIGYNKPKTKCSCPRCYLAELNKNKCCKHSGRFKGVSVNVKREYYRSLADMDEEGILVPPLIKLCKVASYCVLGPEIQWLIVTQSQISMVEISFTYVCHSMMLLSLRHTGCNPNTIQSGTSPWPGAVAKVSFGTFVPLLESLGPCTDMCSPHHNRNGETGVLCQCKLDKIVPTTTREHKSSFTKLSYPAFSDLLSHNPNLKNSYLEN